MNTRTAKGARGIKGGASLGNLAEKRPEEITDKTSYPDKESGCPSEFSENPQLPKGWFVKTGQT